MRRIAISQELLQPYIWVVPSLFQEAICSDLTVTVFFLNKHLQSKFFSKVLSCSYPFNEWPFFYYKNGITATHFFQIDCGFTEQGHCVQSVRIRSYSGLHFRAFRLKISLYSVRMRENADQNNSEYEHFSRTGIVVTNYDTPLVSGLYLLEDILLFDDIISSHLFILWQCRYFTGALEAIHMSRKLCSFHKTYCSYLTRGLWFIRESVRGIFIWGISMFEENHCNLGLMKVSIYSTSSVFWTDFGQNFKFQAKKELSSPCIPIFENL